MIALAADVPPDVTVNGTATLPPVLVGRGNREEWYTQEKLEKDLKYLRTVTTIESLEFDGGHEFTDEWRATIGAWLASRAEG